MQRQLYPKEEERSFISLIAYFPRLPRFLGFRNPRPHSLSLMALNIALTMKIVGRKARQNMFFWNLQNEIIPVA